MNLKEVSRRMSKKTQHKWIVENSVYTLIGEQCYRVYSTTEHLTAEIVTKKLRGMGYIIVGDVPAAKDLRD